MKIINLDQPITASRATKQHIMSCLFSYIWPQESLPFSPSLVLSVKLSIYFIFTAQH